jgi:hypothetical protein
VRDFSQNLYVKYDNFVRSKAGGIIINVACSCKVALYCCPPPCWRHGTEDRAEPCCHPSLITEAHTSGRVRHCFRALYCIALCEISYYIDILCKSAVFLFYKSREIVVRRCIERYLAKWIRLSRRIGEFSDNKSKNYTPIFAVRGATVVAEVY